MKFSWKKLLTFGIAGAKKLAELKLPGRAGSITDAVLGFIHGLEDVGGTLGLSGKQKFDAVRTRSLEFINALFVASGKKPVITDRVQAAQQAYVDATVELENAVAEAIELAEHDEAAA